MNDYKEKIPLSYVTTHKENDTLQNKVLKFAALADSGDIFAAFYYGEMLLTGVWDEDRMMMDQLSGNLVPQPSTPNTSDTYLILPRNPVRAVDFLKRTADAQNSEHFYEVRRARGLLNFLQSKNLAGFFEVHSKFKCPSGDKLSSQEQKFLAQCTRNSLRAESNRFVPIRDTRPQLIPKSSILFRNIATRYRNRCFLQCIVSNFLFSVTPFLFECIIRKSSTSVWPLFLVSLSVNFIFFTIPLLIFAWIAQIFGIEKWYPICDCKHIDQAYDALIEDNPSVFEVRKNPFRATNGLISFSHQTRQFLFWTFSFFSVVSLGFHYFKSTFIVYMLDDYGFNRSLAVSVPIVVIVMSSIILFYDKKPQNFCQEFDKTSSFFDHKNGHILIFLFIFIIIFVFEDRDCRIEYENVMDAKNLEARKESVLRRFDLL